MYVHGGVRRQVRTSLNSSFLGLHSVDKGVGSSHWPQRECHSSLVTHTFLRDSGLK